RKPPSTPSAWSRNKVANDMRPPGLDSRQNLLIELVDRISGRRSPPANAGSTNFKAVVLASPVAAAVHLDLSAVSVAPVCLDPPSACRPDLSWSNHPASGSVASKSAVQAFRHRFRQLRRLSLLVHSTDAAAGLSPSGIQKC